MTPQVKHFLAEWHQAVRERDEDRIRSIMAEGCELHSPVVWKPSSDTRYILHILMGVISTVENFDYRKEWVDGDDLMLEFTGTVDGKGLVGLDRITLDEAGRMTRLEVFIRPLNTLVDFAEKMREHALRYKPEAANG